MKANIKFQVAEKIGGFQAELMPDLKKVNIEGIGTGEISYASFNPGMIIINHIDYVRLSDSGNEVLQSKGVDISKDVKFRIPESTQNEIKERFNSTYDDFKTDVLNGKIQIKISIVGSDFPHAVLASDLEEYEGLKMWDLFYNYFSEELHIYDAYKWIDEKYQKSGIDVTWVVISKMLEKERIKQEKEEKKKQIFEKAKTTGENQLLYKYSDECNDPEESCDIDDVYIFAMPDGATEEERFHNW